MYTGAAKVHNPISKQHKDANLVGNEEDIRPPHTISYDNVCVMIEKYHYTTMDKNLRRWYRYHVI